MSRMRWPSALGALAAVLLWAAQAQAADTIRIGFSMALTGGVAPIGKQILAALQIWRDRRAHV